MRRISFIIFLMIIFTGCSNSSEDNIEKLLEKTPFPNSFEVLYQEKVDNGLIVLFKDESGFRHAFFSNKTEYWNISGNADLNPKDGFVWGMTNDPKIPKLTFAGVITDDNIQNVMVRQKTLNQQARMVSTDKGRFWFTIFDNLEEAAGQSDPLKIEAISAGGDIVWKDGVYNGKYYHGKT
ncbi:hypothetical protein [Paenibacillus roseipurpureus]|uniref:Uncharacterized protein n=1 Tax=Paenibacillus roseopurpureus TaxID=2918901 RepID=A0AA96LLZ6_9BACL|nr:hypothetical protein [Paenibacillus sp. MBLB1832]WNR44417.1 hypothetical protein MJB10_25700 [Paenibacillus sp. MBLB1832]